MTNRSLAVDWRPVVKEGEHDLDAVRAAPFHDLLNAVHEIPVVGPCTALTLTLCSGKGSHALANPHADVCFNIRHRESLHPAT